MPLGGDRRGRMRRQVAFGGRGRRAGVLGGAGPGLSAHPPPALLAAQGGQHPERPAQKRPASSEAGTAADLMAETRDDAEAAFKSFVDAYQDKYPKAAERPPEDRDELPAACGFPAAHWQSIRTASPIESTFATIRHRTKRSRGCLNRRRMLWMMFKLGICAERRLSGFGKLGKVAEGMQFKDGIEAEQPNDQMVA